MLAAGAALAGGRPHVVFEPLLGTEWQCSRTAFLVTSRNPVRKQNSMPPLSVGRMLVYAIQFALDKHRSP